MEVDSIVTPKSHPTELEVAFSIGTIFNVANVFSGVEGSLPIQVPTPIKVRAHFDDTIDPTILYICGGWNKFEGRGLYFNTTRICCHYYYCIDFFYHTGRLGLDREKVIDVT